MLYKTFLNKIVLYFFLIFFINTNSISLENKVILKIDNYIVTSIDIELEKNYLIALNPKAKELSKKRLNLIAKNSLVREKIKKNEILNYLEKIELNKDYLDRLIKERYLRLNLNNKEEFLNHLTKYNLEIKFIEEKISIEALWNQLIYQKFSKNVKIDKQKLLTEIRTKNKEDEKNLLLSEIVFQITKKNDLEKKYLEIQKNIKEEGFDTAALTFSISDSATSGGKLGWIVLSSLNNTIKKELKNLEKGDITKPIFTPNGYIILKIDDIKFIKKNLNIETELEQLIEFNKNNQLKQQSIVYFNKIKKNANINEL